MLELSSNRKNKINLSDYNWQQDVESRLLMSDLSSFDIEILEEILFSPLKISRRKLLRSLDCEEDTLLQTLQKFASVDLLSLQEDIILVDKERRKYFEFQITRFDPQFKPDMEYIQGQLKKVPIQALPGWYAIPRSSNNIFESIVEKYLLTPHIYQRYLQDLNFGDPVLTGILNDVLTSPDLKVSSTDLITKYNLKRKDFEEAVLFLEFNFACCLCYEKQDDYWLEYLSPFHEWKEYLNFIQSTESKQIPPGSVIEQTAETDFAFIEEMSSLLLRARQAPLSIASSPAVEKLVLTKLSDYKKGQLTTLSSGEAWLDLSKENRSLYLYRHANNRILSCPAGERYIREAEKSVKRLKHNEWVYFDDFFKGVLVPLNDQSAITLKKIGKQWKYTLPEYGEEEFTLLKAVIFEWLYEMGMTRTGMCQGKPCFAMTHFGRFFFND